MRIDGLQLAPDYASSIDERRAAAATAIRSSAGADLVVLPELWPQGGFVYQQWSDLAEPVDGPTLAMLAEAARAIGAHVHGGSIIERDAEGRLYNTSLLVAPDGSLLETYRKIHLFGFSEGEPELLTAGGRVVVAETALGPVGLATCYDLRFPELFRALVDGGAELIVVPAAWPESRVGHWSLLARARAVEDQVVVIAVNTAGDQAGKTMGGFSVVVDARGVVRSELTAGPGVVSAEIDRAEVRAWRERFPVLRDRRM